MVVTYKDWHEILPYALHGYHTSVRTSTGATLCPPNRSRNTLPKSLVEVELDEVEWVQQRLDQLNFIEEKRLTALCHG
ncbi:hypothetical protein CR513_15681, partial [Mucuna pruriens]